jgi:hypothetical protein
MVERAKEFGVPLELVANVADIGKLPAAYAVLMRQA